MTMEATRSHDEHFESLERQVAATRLGMWIFLVSEVLLFAALFTLYATYRADWPRAFEEAVGHNPILIGTVNTAVLIVASFTVAMGLHHLQHGRSRTAVAFTVATVGLALLFLGIKGYEYSIHVTEGILPGGKGRFFETHAVSDGFAAFFTLYYVTTGLHGIHVTVGAAVLAALAIGIHRGRIHAERSHPLELGALYWHLVDCIWIFLWPLYYLLGTHR